ncbi:hypothetical protein MP228_006117 [Amoeboaphelidium protococcarum]|nr:hypothetical protein MP228_006117 [Amoeboaphelidium protococcarum]
MSTLIMNEEDQLELQAYQESLRSGSVRSGAADKKQKKVFANNVNLMKERAAEMELSRIAGHQLEFLDHLVHVVSPLSAAGGDDDNDQQQKQKINAEDDIKRELSFYSQALATAQYGISNIKPFFRPDDYFAEMVKSDDHMTKIKTRIVEEQEKIKKSEEAKRRRDMKKFGKNVKAEVLKERSIQKKREADKIESFKKRHKRNNDDAPGDQFDIDAIVGDSAADKKRSQHKKRNGSHSSSKSKFERVKAGKNSSRSSSGSGGAKKGGVAKAARPGKSRRKAQSGKRR